MAYEVTATRKRPQDFDKLVGQEFVVSTLENAIKEGRIAHAYLFQAPEALEKQAPPDFWRRLSTVKKE